MAFSYRDETKELNEVTRRETGGSFIQLPDGFTHYELSNPEAEHTVVLVHGFSVPCFVYDPTFSFLTQAGLRVLRYDLFGRGFSDRPHTRYSVDLFVKQLGDLLDSLCGQRPASLVGLSAGGIIAATFTSRFPERVRKLVLIDPVGAKRPPSAKLLKLVTLPLVGEVIADLIRSDRLSNRFTARVFGREVVEHFQPRYAVQMQFKGFRRALLSTLRNKVLDAALQVYERVGSMGKPVLLFWGRNDPTVPFLHSELLRQAMPQADLHTIEGCGHLPHYERPDVVNPILLRFLNS
jgi:pimeloyl-ACP methyl ester carboxylesterase